MFNGCFLVFNYAERDDLSCCPSVCVKRCAGDLWRGTKALSLSLSLSLYLRLVARYFICRSAQMRGSLINDDLPATASVVRVKRRPVPSILTRGRCPESFSYSTDPFFFFCYARISKPVSSEIAECLRRACKSFPCSSIHSLTVGRPVSNSLHRSG